MAAEAELSRLAAAAPRAVVKDGVVIGADTELNARMAAVREEQRCLAEFIASHAWITASGNRYAAWKTVDQAAKAAE